MVADKKMYFRTLTIAGSDSSGGAGIQADLKTFSALGCFGMSAITALTAQNTQGVRSIENVSPNFIKDQIESVLEDIGADAIKIGMLYTVEIIQIVAETIKKYDVKHIVVDPVMVSKSGHRLLQKEAIEALKKELLPITTVLTPNLPEASELLGQLVLKKDEMENAALELLQFGPKAVLIKGGHLEFSESSDVLAIDKRFTWFQQNRIETVNNHGTGCTLSAAITAYLAQGFKMKDAVRLSKQYLTCALESGTHYKIGKGHGPVHHFFK